MSIKNVFLKLTMVLFTMSLIACGGGGSSSSSSDSGSTNADVAGKVIDGYIEGATIFYDLNYNGELDDGEPSVVSGEGGLFNLTFEDETQKACAWNSPLVVDVPVGAVDLENGTVTEAYQMFRAPNFGGTTEETTAHITPLTSVLWTKVQSMIFQEYGADVTCEYFSANPSAIQDILLLMDETVQNVSQTLGLTEEELYSDYVEEQNAVAHDLAGDIVPVLAKSLEDTLALKAQYGDTNFVVVQYYQGSEIDNENAYPDAWYKDVIVFTNERTIYELTKVEDDLETEIRPISYSERVRQNPDSNTEVYTFTTFESRLGDDSDYTCQSSEGYIYADEDILNDIAGTQNMYEIQNIVNKSSADFDGCTVDDFELDATTRNILTRIDSVSEQNTETAPFGLSGWFNFSDNYGTLDYNELIGYASSL